MADVLAHGSQPVPPHLLNAPIARMKSHGIGVGYRYPHDYEGADIQQQDLLVERTYHVPTGEGMERLIGERLERVREARSAGPARRTRATGPAVDHMRVARDVTKAREAARERPTGEGAA